MIEPKDYFEELKLAGPRDEYDRWALELPSIQSLPLLAATCREKDQQIKLLILQRAELALALVKHVGAGEWSRYANHTDIGREILAEFAEEDIQL